MNSIRAQLGSLPLARESRVVTRTSVSQSVAPDREASGVRPEGDTGSSVDMSIAAAIAASGDGSPVTEYVYVIEGAGKTCGMAAAQRTVATVLYDFAGLN